MYDGPIDAGAQLFTHVVRCRRAPPPSRKSSELSRVRSRRSTRAHLDAAGPRISSIIPLPSRSTLYFYYLLLFPSRARVYQTTSYTFYTVHTRALLHYILFVCVCMYIQKLHKHYVRARVPSTPFRSLPPLTDRAECDKVYTHDEQVYISSRSQCRRRCTRLGYMFNTPLLRSLSFSLSRLRYAWRV